MYLNKRRRIDLNSLGRSSSRRRRSSNASITTSGRSASGRRSNGSDGYSSSNRTGDGGGGGNSGNGNGNSSNGNSSNGNSSNGNSSSNRTTSSNTSSNTTTTGNNTNTTNTNTKTNPDPSLSPQLERAVKKELVYLSDPLKHAHHVRQTLRSNEYDKAVALCRIASRDMQVIVSWNHMIDWLLVRSEVKLALKTYNEMKKRAQFPDSHTYLILLRGLAIPPIHAETVGKALAIYHSLAAPNSRVTQSIIHTNAALKVCARAHDMESMWGIASRIPEKGAAAADIRTFTIILNAIRENALLGSGPREDDDVVAHARQNAVAEARRIWGDIIGKWRRGDLTVDEELVCAMGRILLLSYRPRDWDDILSLVEQTMNIPRLASKLGTPQRRAEHIPLPRFLEHDAVPNPDEEEMMSEFDRELLTGRKKPGSSADGGSIIYVRPGNQTLSLVMEACLKMASGKIAHDYWDLLIGSDTYAITPDVDNLNMYLRLLRQARASARTVDVLKDNILARGIRPLRKTYRIAMSAAVRDKLNPNAIKHADAILDMMENNLSEIDVKATQMYLDLAIGTQDGPTIVRATGRLAPLVQNLRSQLSYGSDGGARPDEDVIDEALLLFRTIIGAIDQLTQKAMIPQDQHTTWVQRRSKLAGFVTKYMAKTEGKAPLTPGTRRKIRTESRQLRHFRHNDVRRVKRGDGSWVNKHEHRHQGDGSKGRVMKLEDSPAHFD